MAGRLTPAAARRSPCEGPNNPPASRLALSSFVVMRPLIIAANWKMNTTPADAGELAATIAARTEEPGVIRVICPPYVCLAAVRDALAGKNVAVGAQNVHHELAGAYTGEVSAAALAGLATWVILGHSERRRDQLEIGRADRQEAGPGHLVPACGPILCVGELLAEREAGPCGRGRGDTASRRSRRQGHRRSAQRRLRHRLRAGLGHRHRPHCVQCRCGRHGRGDPRDSRRRTSVGARARISCRSCTAAA